VERSSTRTAAATTFLRFFQTIFENTSLWRLKRLVTILTYRRYINKCIYLSIYAMSVYSIHICSLSCIFFIHVIVTEISLGLPPVLLLVEYPNFLPFCPMSHHNLCCDTSFPPIQFYIEVYCEIPQECDIFVVKLCQNMPFACKSSKFFLMPLPRPYPQLGGEPLQGI